MPAGEDLEGCSVRFCRGDMRVHEAVTDADGRYRIEHLTAGPWMVQAYRAARPTGGGAAAIEYVEPSDSGFPWVCQVYNDETTRYDLTLGGAGIGRLVGGLSIDGQTDGSFSVRLHSTRRPWHYELAGSRSTELNAHGEFTFDRARVR